ncbi:MAG: extensin family protein, partial [Candidatus Devosia euplotis]|nr:extensin family protein [Candidatus Devosia euplotis]
QVDGYAQAMLQSGLGQINTGQGYMCRNRNNVSDGLMSEHGLANALDISGFTLADGKTLAVKTGNLPEGRLLRLTHDAACGRFTTVLGPRPMPSMPITSISIWAATARAARRCCAGKPGRSTRTGRAARPGPISWRSHYCAGAVAGASMAVWAAVVWAAASA